MSIRNKKLGFVLLDIIAFLFIFIPSFNTMNMVCFMASGSILIFLILVLLTRKGRAIFQWDEGECIVLGVLNAILLYHVVFSLLFYFSIEKL